MPDVDETGRGYAVLAFGPDAVPVAERWRDRIAALGRPVALRRFDRASDEALAALGEQLRDATVGWRLMLTGPEIDIRRAHAVAIAAGALDAELTLLITDDERRRVWCPHCTATTEADVRPGESVPCSGCGRTLVVHAQVSRRRAAYLGTIE